MRSSLCFIDKTALLAYSFMSLYTVHCTAADRSDSGGSSSSSTRTISSLQHQQSQNWSAGTYPYPPRDAALCKHEQVVRTELLCDPDLLITDAQADQLDVLLAHVAEADLPYPRARCNSRRVWQGFEFGIALMRRLDNRFGKPMDQAVRHMAVALFNSWRLGGQYCEVGFLILYVSDLQQVQIHAGKPLRDVVTRARLDKIIGRTSNQIQSSNLTHAIEGAVEELIDLVSNPDSYYGQTEIGRLPTALTLFLLATVALIGWISMRFLRTRRRAVKAQRGQV